MKLFPTSNYNFTIIGEPSESLDRLKRRTEISESLVSKKTNKSFVGKITNNTFKIISSEIGKGAFCVLNGEIINKNGVVDIEINKAFKILLSFFLCFPAIGIIVQLCTEKIKFSPIFVLVAILQVLLIRFVFIEVAFRNLSKKSLNRLSDVLDIESFEKN